MKLKKFLLSASLFLLSVFACTTSNVFACVPTYYPPVEVRILGGSYEQIRNQYYDTSKYEVHHLIAREAWNRLGDEIRKRQGSTCYNDFVVDDLDQNWAPSILMEKSDHEKTASYYNTSTRTARQNKEAKEYINYQAEILLLSGNIQLLLNEECDIIRIFFPGKYDRAIGQMFAYMHRRFWFHDGTLFIRHPHNRSCCLMYKTS